MKDQGERRRAERLCVESELQGRKADELRADFVDHELDRLDRERALEADVLLITVTTTETKELERAAATRAGQIVTRQQGKAGRYRILGDIGGHRVVAIRLREAGSYAPQGSAFTCYVALAETGATTLIGLGTAYGVDEIRQSIGDVLVSTSLVLYDEADVSESVAVTKSSYQYDYGARARVGASIGWVERLRQLDKVRPDTALLHFGTLLAGAAHVVSETFRDELVERVQAVASDYDPVVGGEMEAAGLAAACRQAESDWMVVKGISDFATPESRLAIKANRIMAARNAAETVMDALTLNARAR